MKSMTVCAASFAAVVSALTTANAAEEVWSLDGFQAPETVLFDQQQGVFFVSNIAGQVNEKDGVGFISKVSSDGKMIDAEWVTGLDAPKGMAQYGNTLYVADVDRLVAVDAASGEITGNWAAEGAQFLNDVAADESGRVFVSDTFADRIYVLEDDAVTVFLEGPELLHPNGLHVSDGKLFVSGWGENLKNDFTTETLGRVVMIDLESKEVSEVGSGKPIGNLDGLEQDESGQWLATDWMAGALFQIDAEGNAKQLLDLEQGSANFEFLPSENTVVIPMMMEGRIVAYRLE